MRVELLELEGAGVVAVERGKQLVDLRERHLAAAHLRTRYKLHALPELLPIDRAGHVLVPPQEDVDDALAIRVSCHGVELTADSLAQLFDGREPPLSKGVPNLAVARSILRQEGGDLELVDAGDDDGWFSLELRLVPVIPTEPAYRLGEAHDA